MTADRSAKKSTLPPPLQNSQRESSPPVMSQNLPSSRHRRRTNPSVSFGKVVSCLEDSTRDEVDSTSEAESSPVQRTARIADMTIMGNINEIMEKLIAIDGCFAAALVDYESGMTLGTRNTSQDFDIEIAASGHTQVVRAKMSVMNQLGIGDGIDDILITLDTQLHIIRLLHSAGSLFLYLAIDRKRGSLGLARHNLAGLEKDLRI